MTFLVLLIAFNLACIAGTALLALRRCSAGALSPTVITLAGLGLMYVLRPAYILSQDSWGLAPQYLYEIRGWLSDLTYAMVLGSLGVFVFCGLICISLFMGRRPLPRHCAMGGCTVRVAPLTIRQAYAASLVFYAASIGAGSVLAYAVAATGGPEAYVSALGSRSTLFKDVFGPYGFYVEVLFFFVMSAYLMVFANAKATSPSVPAHLLLAGVAALLLIGALGGRSNILFFIVGLCYIHVICTKRQRSGGQLGPVLLISVAVLLVGIVYRVLLRDIHFSANQGGDVYQLVADSVGNVFGFLVGGFDFVQIDALTLLVADPSLGPLYGATLAAAIVSFIPRALWPAKPSGAMSEFTSHYFPAHYSHSGGGEFVVSWFGEMYLNFSVAGVFVAAAFVAWFVVKLERATQRTVGVCGLVVVAVLLTRPFNLLKADFTNNFMAVAKLLLIPILFLLVGYVLRNLRRHPQ